MRPPSLFLLTLTLLFSSLAAPCQPKVLVVQGNDFKGMVSLDTFFQWAADSTGEMQSEEAQHLPFQEFSGTFNLDKKFNYWFRLPICNASPDSLKALLCLNEFIRSDMFFEKKPAGWERRKAGNWTNYRERSFPSNRYCHPVALANGQERTYFLQLSDYVHIERATPNFRLLTPAQEKERRLEDAAKKSGQVRFKGVFFGILALLAFFALLQFLSHRDRAYLFYAGYIASLFFFYLRNLDLENPLPFFGDLKAFHPNFEAPLGYLCYIFYLAFIRSFLDLPLRLPLLDRFMRWGIATFIGLLAFDLLVLQILWDWRVSMDVHSYAKLPFFILALWLLIPAVFQLKSRLGNYVMTGTMLLLLPAIFTVFADLTNGTYEVLWSSTARSFSPSGSGVTLYMYDMRVGLLLEMVCFMLGLSYKTRLDKLRMQALGVEIEELKKARPPKLPVVEQEHSFVKQARSVVLANLGDDNFGTEELACKLAIGRVQLYRRMNELAHQSPSCFIRSLRMDAARELFRTTSKTVAEVAYQVGFKDASHFSKSYRKTFGLSPKNEQNGL